jgi:hypothetical protein
VIQEPIQPVITGPSGPSSPRRRGGFRLGLVVAVGLAIAVPVIAVTAAPRDLVPTIAAGASPSPDASGTANPGKKDGSKPGIVGRGDRGGAVRGPITIRAISGSQLSLATSDGWSRTIAVTSATVITKGGQPIAVGDLNVGDVVRFSQKRNADGTYAITAIVVPTPTAGGEVTAVTGSSITVKGKGDKTRVLTVNDDTAYKLGKAAGSKADVKVGTIVTAQGTVSGDTFTAITVRVYLPEVGGEVSAKTSDSITIKHRNGSTTVIHISDKTTFEYKGKDAASLADIAIGDRVEAQGVRRADGSIDAVEVEGRAKRVLRVAKPSKAPETSATPG